MLCICTIDGKFFVMAKILNVKKDFLEKLLSKAVDNLDVGKS